MKLFLQAIVFLALSVVAFGQCGANGKLIKNPLTGQWDCTGLPGGVGVTITSPNGTITVGGTGTNPTLDTVATANARCTFAAASTCSITGLTGVVNKAVVSCFDNSGSLVEIIPNDFIGSTADTLVVNFSGNQTGYCNASTGVGATGATGAAGPAGSVSNITNLTPLIYCADTSVSANTITCSVTPSIGAYAAGQAVDVLLANSVTGATTIDVNGLGPQAVTYNGTNPLITGVMLIGGTYRLQFDGTEFVLQGNVSSGGGLPASPDQAIQIDNGGAFGASSAFLVDVATVLPAIFIGTGLNDLTSGGAYTAGLATPGAQFLVTIDATGTPDTFTWTINGGGGATGVAITGAAQTLSDGVTVTFAATTGHTLADQWTVNAGISLKVGDGVNVGVNSSAVSAISLNGAPALHEFGLQGLSVYVGRGAGNFTNTGDNIGIGPGTLSNITDQSGNVAIGGNALGQLSLNSTAGNSSGNVAISTALQNLQAGSENVAIGPGAMANTIGTFLAPSVGNVVIGSAAANSADMGGSSYNVIIGQAAGINYGGSGGNGGNVFIGSDSGQNSTGASGAVFVGFGAGRNATGGSIAIGTGAGSAATASDSVYLGVAAGSSSTGAGNLFLGYTAGQNQTTLSNTLIVNTKSQTATSELTKALMVGKFANNPSDQNLNINVARADVADVGTLAAESLTNPNLTAGTSWTAADDFALAANAATWTFGIGNGTLTQASGTMAIAAVPNRLYKFAYTVSAVTGAPVCEINTISTNSIPLPVNNSGAQVAYVQAAASPGDFVIFCSGVATETVTLDTFSLKEVIGGDTNTGNSLIGRSLQLSPVVFSGLSTVDGTEQYCKTCTVTSGSDNTCAGSGSGAKAVRINGVSKCFI